MYGPPEYFERRRQVDSRPRPTPQPPRPSPAQVPPPSPFVPPSPPVTTTEPIKEKVVETSSPLPPSTAPSVVRPAPIQRRGKTNPKPKKEKRKKFSNSLFLHLVVYVATDSEFAISFAKDIAYSRPTIYENLLPALISSPALLSNYQVLDEKYSSLSFPMSILKNYESKPPFQVEETSFHNFLQNVFIKPQEDFISSHYLQQIEMEIHLPDLMKEIQIQIVAPNYLSKGLIEEELCHSPTFYMGGKGIRTSLHFDRSCGVDDPHFSIDQSIGKNNLFLQISGSRRFILFSPLYSNDLKPSIGTLWPHVSTSTTFLHSVYDLKSPVTGAPASEEEQKEFIRKSPFPWIANVWQYRQEIILHPGEALLIPAQWWHYTEVLEGGSAVNWWFHVDKNLEAKINQRIIQSSKGKDSDSHQKMNGKCIIN